MTIQPSTEHPHGLSDRELDEIFTTDKPVIFAYLGYPWLIHRLTYRRTNHDKFHVRGYKEAGTATTPFGMTVLNDLDRFHLSGDVVDRVSRLQRVGGQFKQFLHNKLVSTFEGMAQILLCAQAIIHIYRVTPDTERDVLARKPLTTAILWDEARPETFAARKQPLHAAVIHAGR